MTVILDAAAGGTILLAAAWAATSLMRRAPADLRRAIWRAAIVGVALLPWVAAVPLDTAAATTFRAAALPSAAAGVPPAGGVFVLGRLAIGLWRVRRWSRTAMSQDGVLYSAGVPVPMTWGLWRPEILLPEAAADWTSAERALVLCHEQAHVADRDWAWQTGARLVAAVFWFHPLVWIADGALRREAERVADDGVLAAGASGTAYATHLVNTARGLRRRTMGAVAMVQPSGLESRVSRVLDAGIRRSGASRTAIAAAIGAAAVLTVTVAAFQDEPVYRAESPVLSRPTVIREVMPTYPAQAKQDKIEGTVTLDVLIDADGQPEQVKVIHSIEESLDRASVDAAGQWRFRPATRDGKPVRVWATIEFEFSLRE
jgi:TonB family protein